MLILEELKIALDTKDGRLVSFPLDVNNEPILDRPTLIESLTSKETSSALSKLFYSLLPSSEHVCHVCGTLFPTKKNNADTCSDACRSKKRHIKKSLSLIGVDNEAFIRVFNLHVKKLDADNFTLSSSYLHENMREFEEIVERLSPRDLKYLILSNQTSI